ncbi:ABC transporter permease protein [Bradyrhizobium sp. STM 3843]|uniref:ABC transporter permease n=1 Tax=Bradyrhizobium sp. STM 3843 TaxID=551947 RepID=UPI0002404986|nr:ABC transporter permease [Bradyrhizobium sp. STM 3843]CCE09292.1 ABC transporter permease protein [Bradyrhizobium sp. STM 3843]
MAEPKAPPIFARALNAAWIRPVLFLVFIVAIWDLSIRLFKIPAYQIPAPADVVAVLRSDWPELLRQSWPTTYATVCGFLLSALFGIPVAMVIAGSKTVESYVYPLLVFSQSVPKIAIAPLFVVWFGFGIIPKVISAFLLGFFPVVVSAVQGFKSVDPDMVDLARAMQGSRFQVFRAVNLPHALPAIFSGLKVSVTLAVVGAVVGEFVGSNSGIGYVMQRSIGTFDLPTMFAALVILALLGVVLFWIVDRIERLIIPWHVSHREDIVFTS